MWEEGLLGQARWDKAGDVNLLAVGGVASFVERFECVLVGGLGEFVLGLQRVVRVERLRQGRGCRLTG
jgi:hypothetical protein